MGYRSNGGFVIFGPEPEMLANLTALRMTQTHPEPWNGELAGLRLYRDGTNLVWHLEYSGWKMYDGYPDVDELNRIYRESAHFAALSGYKWRFGEDDDDVEHDVFGDAADEDICTVDIDLPDTVTHLYQSAYNDLKNYPELSHHAEGQNQ